MAKVKRAVDGAANAETARAEELSAFIREAVRTLEDQGTYNDYEEQLINKGKRLLGLPVAHDQLSVTVLIPEGSVSNFDSYDYAQDTDNWEVVICYRQVPVIGATVDDVSS